MTSSDSDTFIWTELLDLCVDTQWTYLGLVGCMGLLLIVEARSSLDIQRFHLICLDIIQR